MKGIYKLIIILVNLAITVAFFTFLPRYCDGIILGIAIFVITVFTFYLQYNLFVKNYLKDKLKQEAKFLFNDPVSWILGFAIGSFLSGLIIFSLGIGKYSNTDVNPSSFDIMGIYIGSILGVIAVRSFYQNLHPIYDELELIELLTEDLIQAKEDDIIMFSFPAFNLCEFRTEAKLVNGEKEFKAYTDELNSRINTYNNHFHGFCYTAEDIKKLYDTYITMNSHLAKGIDLNTVKETCITTASDFITLMQTQKSKSKNTKFHPIDPENPIEPFFIIGNIVYTLQTWGLPYFREGKFHDPFVGSTNDKLVRLIARRQVDKQLAKSIIHRTNTISNKLWQSQPTEDTGTA